MKKIQYTLFAALFFLFALTVKAQDDLFLSYTIDPMKTLTQLQDIPVRPSTGTASSFHSGDGIEKSFDNNMTTLYHSEWGNVNYFPITLQYNFKNVDKIDYLVYNPRTDLNTNGNFKEIEVWYKLQDAAAEVKLGDYDFKGVNMPSTVNFTTPLINPEYIKIVVKSGVGDNAGIGFASCAEMQFFVLNERSVNLSNFFADDIYSQLKSGVTIDQIYASDLPVFFKMLAAEIASGDYSPYRVQEYEAYRPVGDLANELKLSTYNQYENPTGILSEAGKQMLVFVPDTKGETIFLSCMNWDVTSTNSYPLKKGINYITPSISGNTYISYYTDNYKTAEPVKVHIYGGKVNGVFYQTDDKKDTNDTWKSLLANATGDYLDIVGQYVNLTYYVSGLKTACPNDGVRLIELYDEIIAMQYDQMGFNKYNRVPKNHMFGRNTLDGYMSAGGIGVNMQYETLSSIGNPSNIIQGDNSWGIAHEFGHVNQIRPGLKWIGTTEMFNNVYSSYNQYVLTSKYATLHMRLEHENCRDIDGGANVMGGRFNSYLHYGVLKGDNWMFQWGQDGPSDHFVKLAPLWQLNLYFMVAQGTPWAKPDWYADICEVTRLDQATYTNGEHQINFMKRACQYTQTDLIEFFEKAGILKPIDVSINDYGTQRLTITQAMCDEVKAYVQENGWAKPAGIINYISGNTVKIFEQRLPVEGTLNQGVSGSGTARTVSHTVWKNAVVYETYQGDELVRITMAGTGTANNSSTRVPYPAGATKIVAVSWDGVRTTVYQP